MPKDTKSMYRSSLYEYDYSTGKIKLKNRLCPRCGSVMAFHRVGRTRWHCGKCNYTLFIEEKAK
ncbi:MAG: 30S ribosomal protein S27ae [Ignisphaera sp.]|uniref:Small ribosomal subunit protein eS31 n=1 Tax=Ignisphaera aggregans TaxID=334771 RepID=A0A7C4H362_9CREN